MINSFFSVKATFFFLFQSVILIYEISLKKIDLKSKYKSLNLESKTFFFLNNLGKNANLFSFRRKKKSK